MRKNVFYFTSFLKQSSFNFSDMEMSEMLKHETRNTLYIMAWEVNTVW